jgi:Tol biopolymer transport system component
MNVTRLESGQSSHRFPQFLPDGQHFIYLEFPASSVYVGSLDGSPSKRLTNADAAAVVSPLGSLLFLRQTTLFAEAFDFRKLELLGNPVPVAEQLPLTFAPKFSTEADIVAYRASTPVVTRQLIWLDRSGQTLSSVGAPEATLFDPQLSPDGKRIAIKRNVDRNNDIWLIDATRGVPTRFTFDALSDGQPRWSPDGSQVVFQSNRTGVYDLYRKAASGAGTDELLLKSDQNKGPEEWSPDGRFLLFHSLDPKTRMDLWVLPTSGDQKPSPFLKTPFEERDAQFSPDGRWVVYQSDESNRFEIYVRPFPGPGGKFQISANGGAQPRWNKNGKEIFYVSLDSKMMAAPVKLSPDGQSVETGSAVTLFPVRIAGGPLITDNQQYAVSADGQRFLVNLEVGEGTTSPITIIYHWHPPKP